MQFCGPYAWPIGGGNASYSCLPTTMTTKKKKNKEGAILDTALQYLGGGSGFLSPQVYVLYSLKQMSQTLFPLSHTTRQDNLTEVPWICWG